MQFAINPVVPRALATIMNMAREFPLTLIGLLLRVSAFHHVFRVKTVKVFFSVFTDLNDVLSRSQVSSCFRETELFDFGAVQFQAYAQ